MANDLPLSVIEAELRDALVDARFALWNALDHLNVDDPDEAPTIKQIDALLARTANEPQEGVGDE